MKKSTTKNVIKGIGIGMMVTGGAAIIGSMMPQKKNTAKQYIETMLSGMNSLLK